MRPVKPVSDFQLGALGGLKRAVLVPKLELGNQVIVRGGSY